MNNIKKVFACLCTSIIAASAMAETITFDGHRIINGHGYLKFDLQANGETIQIDKVSIDSSKLDQGHDKIVTLTIPGEVDGKRVQIKKGAFQYLKAKNLQLTLRFQEIVTEFSKYKNEKYRNSKVNRIRNSKVQLPSDCSSLFDGSTSLVGIDLSGVGTSNMNNTVAMFRGCTNLQSINFGNFFDTRGVKNMSSMFVSCKSLSHLDLSGFNTKSVNNMVSMFANCRNLQHIDIGTSFDTQNVRDMSFMFQGCGNLKDYPNINMKNAKNTFGMFARDSAFSR